MSMFDYRAPTMKFPVEGRRQGGRVTDVEQYHETEYGTGVPMYWVNGRPVATTGAEEGDRPVMRWRITVETGEADDNGETERCIWFNKYRLETAFTLQAKKVKLRSPEALIGWNLWVTRTGKEPVKGAQPADTWAVELEPVAGGEGSAGVEPVLVSAAAARTATVGIRDTKVDDDTPPF